MSGVVDLIFGKDDPPPVDYSAATTASTHAVDVADDRAQKLMEQNQKNYDETMKVVKPTVEANLDIMNQSKDQAKGYYDHWKDTGLPVEGLLKDRAMTDTTARDATARGTVTDAQTAAADQLRAGGTTLEAAGGAAANKIIDTSKGLAGDLTTGTRGITDDLNTNTANIVNGLNRNASNVVTGLVDRTAGVGTDLTRGVRGAAGSMTNQVKDVAGTMEAGIRHVGDNLTGKTVGIAQDLSGDTARAGMALTDKAGTVASNITNKTTGYEGKIGDKIDAISGGNQALYDKYGADIEGDVGRAVGDARRGQTQAADMATRQALRYGVSVPATTAATEIANAERLTAAANNARQAGLDKARGNLTTGANLQSNLMQTAGNQTIAAGGLETDAGKAVLGVNANALDTGAKLKTGALTDASQMDAQALGAGANMRSGAIKDATGMEVDALGKQAGMNASAISQGANAGIDVLKQGAAMGTDVLKTGAGLNTGALAGSTALQDSGTRTGVDLAMSGVKDKINLDQAAAQGDVKAAATGRDMTIQDNALATGKLMDVAGLTRNMPGASSGAYTVATNAGNSAVGNTMAPGQVLTTGMNQANSTAMQGQQIGVTGLTNITNTQQGANNNAVAHAYDQANATTNFLFSSKKLKHHKRPVSGKKVTEGLQRTPIGSWKYNKGVADGGEHIGPMAEDMHKQFSDRVAPGGKMLDPISLHGIALTVGKNNANRLDRIERKLGLTRRG